LAEACGGIADWDVAGGTDPALGAITVAGVGCHTLSIVFATEREADGGGTHIIGPSVVACAGVGGCAFTIEAAGGASKSIASGANPSW